MPRPPFPFNRAPGAIVYRGPSMIDGAPIVAVLQWKTTNRKIGRMAQLWILRDGIHPMDAIHTGADASICGDCPHRGREENGRHGVGRTCYVMTKPIISIFRALERGSYLPAAPEDLPALGRDQTLRLGAYGDPAALPMWVLHGLTSEAAAWTGYTHQWRLGFALQDLCMASCDTDADVRDAVALGYRVFRVHSGDPSQRLPAAPDGGRFIVCPAAGESKASRKLTCAECKACNGTASARRSHIQIAMHGARVRRLPVVGNAERPGEVTAA